MFGPYVCLADGKPLAQSVSHNRGREMEDSVYWSCLVKH